MVSVALRKLDACTEGICGCFALDDASGSFATSIESEGVSIIEWSGLGKWKQSLVDQCERQEVRKSGLERNEVASVMEVMCEVVVIVSQSYD